MCFYNSQISLVCCCLCRKYFDLDYIKVLKDYQKEGEARFLFFWRVNVNYRAHCAHIHRQGQRRHLVTKNNNKKLVTCFYGYNKIGFYSKLVFLLSMFLFFSLLNTMTILNFEQFFKMTIRRERYSRGCSTAAAIVYNFQKSRQQNDLFLCTEPLNKTGSYLPKKIMFVLFIPPCLRNRKKIFLNPYFPP